MTPGDGSTTNTRDKSVTKPGSPERERPGVRAAMPADADMLTALAIRSKAHWGYPDEFLAACRAELTYDAAYLARHEVYVVEIADRVAGFCTLERLDEERVELGGLFVEPAFIGTGLGRALMQQALVAARRAGARTMVIHGDPHAGAFYEASGAVQVGKVASQSIPGRLLPLYEIDLREHC